MFAAWEYGITASGPCGPSSIESVVYQILDVLLETGFIGDPGTGKWRSHLREDLFMVFSFLHCRIQLKTSMELYRADFR